MPHIRSILLMLAVALFAIPLSATNVTYLFKNDTNHEVVFHGSLGAASCRCLSNDFTIKLYPRGSQYMTKPCVITSFDVHITKDGKRMYVGSYQNSRGDTCNRKWSLKRTLDGGVTQFHLVTE